MTSQAEGGARTAGLDRRWRWGGVLLGVGLGAFFDGIVLHQLLQWHHMVSSEYEPDTVRNLKINTLGDGLFHVGAAIFTVIGLLLLWSGTRGRHPVWPTSALIGTLLFGWGLFNDIEGLVDHHLLQLHHVRPGPNQLAYDLGYLLWGAVMLVIGWALMRNTRTKN
ncbi:DUF2243 domain-containing protein [Deinococcus sonorensis]|uniref:DUF2243 domain-containing protein n=2 Tax=Deinococcus sonorensis TaxID=309891 RepID=A0AAU7U892_9DEIO